MVPTIFSVASRFINFEKRWIRNYKKFAKNPLGNSCLSYIRSCLLHFQFCQPLGWALSTERQEPRFFVSVLTDIDANRHYCACLCFNETVAITPSKPVDEDEENLTPARITSLSSQATITHHSVMYAPKCLVLVSRLDYTETFRVSIRIFLILEQK